MLNQVVLVAKLSKEPQIMELETGKKATYIELAVSKSYESAAEERKVDIITCLLLGGIAENVTELCRKGDLVGIKGSLITEKFLFGNQVINRTVVMASRVTFLSNKGDK